LERKIKILETAFALFTAKGYSTVTMEQIAHSCGVGKATLYQVYPTKEALILGCVDYFTQRISAEMEHILNDTALSPQKKMVEFIVPVVQFVSKINVYAMEDIQRNVPEVFKQIDVNRKKIILANISRIITEGKEKGIVRPEVNGALVAQMLAAAITHLGLLQVQAELGLSAEQVLSGVLSVIWEGCLSDMGRIKKHASGT
jgi:AcrR family transcriptional regulator